MTVNPAVMLSGLIAFGNRQIPVAVIPTVMLSVLIAFGNGQIPVAVNPVVMLSVVIAFENAYATSFGIMCIAIDFPELFFSFNRLPRAWWI